MLNQESEVLPWQTTDWLQVCSQYVNGRLPHAQLLCGEQGIGKFEFALSQAQFLLCQNPTEQKPCGSCRSCVLFVESQHPDLQLIAAEEGKQQISVDQIRSLLNFVANTSHSGGAKVVIIKDVHRLNLNAANALLKTLEEPTEDSYLILITPFPARLMATIRSRCQLRSLRVPSEQDSLQWLQKLLAEPPGDLAEIMGHSRGRPLQVLANIESGAIEERREIQGALMAVLGQRTKEIEFVSRSKKWSVPLIVEILSENLVLLLKSAHGVDNGRQLTPEIAQVRQKLVGEADSHSAKMQSVSKSLIALYTKCEEAKKQLQGNSNPNPQLILEDLIWQWGKLLRAAA